MRELPTFDTGALYAALDAGRREHGPLNERRRARELTWAALADEIGCTPARLTNLRTAKLTDMDLAMRITQWLGRPAAAFIHPASW